MPPSIDSYSYIYECFGIDTVDQFIRERQDKFISKFCASDNLLCCVIYGRQAGWQLFAVNKLKHKKPSFLRFMCIKNYWNRFISDGIRDVFETICRPLLMYILGPVYTCRCEYCSIESASAVTHEMHCCPLTLQVRFNNRVRRKLYTSLHLWNDWVFARK